jgi:hypothetical protein
MAKILSLADDGVYLGVSKRRKFDGFYQLWQDMEHGPKWQLGKCSGLQQRHLYHDEMIIAAFDNSPLCPSMKATDG